MQRLKSVSLIVAIALILQPIYLVFVNPIAVKAASPLSDPYLRWVKSFGGSGNDTPLRIDKDRYGNIYVVGSFNGTTDFDPGPSTYAVTASSARNTFVTKYNKDGIWQWARTIANPTTNDVNPSVTVTDSGNVYVAGSFDGATNFDPQGAGNIITAVGYNSSPYINKYDDQGNYLATMTLTGGECCDYVQASYIDKVTEMIYLSGSFFIGSANLDFDPGPGIANLPGGPHAEAFVAKYDRNFNYQWVRQITTSVTDNATTAIFAKGNDVYVTGSFGLAGLGTEVDFDPGVGETILTNDEGQDAFIVKYDTAGNYQWVKALVNDSTLSTTPVILQDINIGTDGNPYVTGSFINTTDLDPGVGTQLNNADSSNDIFVLKLDTNGNYIWHRILASSTASNIARTLSFNSLGDMYLSGRFSGTVEFDTTGPGYEVTSAGDTDGFVWRFDVDGDFLSLFTLGGSGSESLNAAFIDGKSTLYLTGRTNGTFDADPSVSTTNVTSGGGIDGFVAKYSLVDRVSVVNLDPSLAAEDKDLLLPATELSSLLNYQLDESPREIRVKDVGDNLALGDVTAALTELADWGDVTGDSDATTGKAFLHKAAGSWSAGEVILTQAFTLLIPKLPSHSAVRVCPGADSFGGLVNNCPGGYIVSEANENVEIVTIDGQDYWQVEGVAGTGGFGLTAANLVVTPSALPTSTANNITLNYLPSGSYSDQDQINVTYDPLYSGVINSGNVAVTKVGDPNFISAVTSNFTSTGFTITLNTTADLDNLNDFEIIISGLTTPVNANNYTWMVSAPEGEGLAALQYIGNENQLNVIGRVDPTLTLAIRNAADTADQANVNSAASGTNLCNLGNLSDAGVQTCSYRLKVTTNAANGYTVNIQTDGDLAKGIDAINNITEDVSDVMAGTEGYGIDLMPGSATGGGTVGGLGIFTDNGSPLGSGTNTALYSSTSSNNPLPTDTVNTALVIHKAEASSATSAGTYTQLVTYTVSAGF
jgi:hypothetical protein